MAKACSLSDVVLQQVEVRGGSFANAVALPSISGNAVLVSTTLIGRLERDETIAILAHELAHIEHYDRQRLRRMATTIFMLVAMVGLLNTVLSMVPPAAAATKTIVIAAWPPFLFFALVAAARRRQKNETASDLRAIALTGDPAALIRALT